MVSFIFYGKAVGKGRPRTVVRGKRVTTYTPQKTKAFEQAIKFECMAQTCERKYGKEIPLYAHIQIGIEVPKSYTKKKREQALGGQIYPSRPDTDNVCKAILDALNNVAYEDDSAVVLIVAEKFYSEMPFVKVEIGEKENFNEQTV